MLCSGHQDDDGVRFPVAGDSIWNGTDDNATVSVALLEVARLWRRTPGFVWHGAQERGVLGSRWFVAHPTVPQSSIVSVLNGDMIGRNNLDSAALLGVQPPHRNSTALVAAAPEANQRTGRFAPDTRWDRPTHPEGWYFRSDHAPYARANIPALFFTTKTKAFARLARKSGISDDALCKAMAQVKKGQAVDLGGGVWKKRLDENRERSIVLAKGERYWVYTYLFGKQDQNNIDDAELAAFRKLATEFAGVSDQALTKLLKKNLWVEICHG